MLQYEPARLDFQGSARLRQILRLAHWARSGTSTTLAHTWLVRIDGSRNPTVFHSFSLAIIEDGVGCSPGTRAARAVTNGGPGADALDYLDEDEEAEDPAPTNEGDDGEDDSSEDEEPTPDVGGDEHQAKQQASFARHSALVGNQVTVCAPAPRHQPPA